MDFDAEEFNDDDIDKDGEEEKPQKAKQDDEIVDDFDDNDAVDFE